MNKALDPFSLSAGVPPIEGDMRPKPKSSARISKKVIVLAATFGGLLLVLFILALSEIDTKPKPSTGQSGSKPDARREGTLEELTGGNGPRNLVPRDPPPPQPPPQTQPPASAASPLPGTEVPAMSGTPIPADDRHKQLSPEEQARIAAETERNNRMLQARATGLSAKPYGAQATGVANQGAGAGGLPMDRARSEIEQMAEAAKQAAKQAAAQSAAAGQGGSDGEQEEKLNFLKERGKEGHDYHQFTVMPPISNKEVKVGHLLPARLEQGINSDLPGMVTARVSEWVYDTVTGCMGLIPPMSTLVGKYDSKVAIGQERVLAVWNRLIFPDGSELNLSAMQGYDLQGMAGMQADVDNHYLRIFGVGLGMSLITAGTQLSVPQSSQTTNGLMSAPTFGQQVATAMAQQYGQLGAQLIGKYAAIQPTLKNFPGESFNIMVPHTIVFEKVWKDRCKQPARPPVASR